MENRRNCMIRITSLDMPKNDYLRHVRKVIYELNLRDEKEVLDEFPDSQIAPSSVKKTLANKLSDDINSNSVLEINNIIDSDGHAGVDETPVNSKQPKKGFKTKNPKSNADKGVMQAPKQMKEASTQ
jgi:hypothetical protein